MYKVLIDYLHHSGRLRVPGELVDMSEADAAPLIKIGAIEAVPEKSPDPVDNGDGDPGDNGGGDSDASKTGKKESKTKAK